MESNSTPAAGGRESLLTAGPRAPFTTAGAVVCYWRFRKSSLATECPVMTTSAAKVLPSAKLSLKDRLSRLSFGDACKLLGPKGRKLIQKNSNGWDFLIADHVFLGDDLFRLRFPGEYVDDQPLIVTITLMAEAPHRLHWHCARCEG